MNLQQVFDNALFGLRKQRVEAMQGRGVCVYRAPQPDGSVHKCAIGHSIPDDVYHPDMDKHGVSNINFVRNEYESIGALFANCDIGALDRLQNLHDSWMPAPNRNSSMVKWEQAMQQFAATYDLRYTPVETLEPA